MTGAGLEALNAAGHARHRSAGARARLPPRSAASRRRLAAGNSAKRTESNVGSTAWVVQGIWAAGGNPETWVIGRKRTARLHGLAAAARRPHPLQESHDLNGVWMTAYAGPAFAGGPCRSRYVPRKCRRTQRRNRGRATPTGGGKPEFERTKNEGGDGFKQGEGVNAGGGGNGAPLFSRPKPQSKGKTPGGARVVRRQKLEAADHSHNRRGANHHQARGTEKVEPRASSEADQEVAAVSAGGRGAAAKVAAAGTKARGRAPRARRCRSRAPPTADPTAATKRSAAP